MLYLFFAAGIEACEDKIIVRNQGVLPVAYKVFTNNKRFVIPEGTGTLLGGELKILTVIMKPPPEGITAEVIQSVKFKVAIVPGNDDCNVMGAGSFWEKYKNSPGIVEKKIITDVKE